MTASARIRILLGALVAVTAAACIGYENVLVWGRQNFHSYYLAKNTERHFGLGKREKVDVSVEFYPSGKKVEARGVGADGAKIISEQ